MAHRLRSWMFVPGNRQRFIDKALSAVPADAVFLDLEDGVPPAEKPEARRLIHDALGRAGKTPLRYVRINPVSSQWFEDDVESVFVPGLQGVCVPKVEDSEQVRVVARQLDERGIDAGIVAAIESACGLVNAPTIAAHPRIVGLIFGGEDFALDLGLGTLREGEAREMIHARSALVIAAASAHRISIDGVYPNLEDPEGLKGDVMQARRLGFTGKSTFNPRQVELINQIFDPTEDELDYARRVVTAFEAAQARGDGSVAVGGQLVDRPIVARAQRILELSQGGR